MNNDRTKAVRVLVFFATNNLSGPGKGLFQLIENTDDKLVEFTICNFRHPKQETFEFLEVAGERGLNIQLITQRWALDSRMISQALRIAEDGEFDIVQSHGYKTHILAWFVARRRKLGWIALSHGWTSENLKIRLYNMIERLMLKLPDSVVGVAPDLYAEAAKIRNGRRSSMILNAIEERKEPVGLCRDTLRQELGIAPSDFVIGVFGRLSFEKGQDLFIDAVGKLVNRDQIKAVLLGEGNARERLVAQTEKSGIEKQVLFAGYQTNIIDYFEAIDLYVLPSRSEGLPNVVLEAQLSCRPVIAFNVGGVGEMIVDEETGYLVKPGDVDALARKIDWASENRVAIQKVVEAARRKLFPKFSVENRCARFVREYNTLIDRPGKT